MIEQIAKIPSLHPNEVYTLDQRDVAEMQLSGLQTRFAELRSEIRAVTALADDLRINSISQLEDVVPLCLPHTVYKSYSAKHIENGRFDRLTAWLDGLTTEDLSAVDVSGCDSLESWLSALEAATRIYPCVSSGTTGKVSFFPRSTVEADVFVKFVIQALAGFRSEADSGIETGEPDFFSPLPMATGRQNMPRMFDLLRRHCYGGDRSRIHTLGQGHWDVDMLWIAGRMRAAAARGETADMELTPAHERVRDAVVGSQAQASANVDQFLFDLVDGYRGRRVILFAPKGSLIEFAGLCRQRGMQPELGRGSFILSGGGTKGAAFPEGWEALLHSVFPPPYQELFAMTEATSLCRLCAAGWYHWSPTVITFVLDPDSGEPLPRSGVQTGRLALFDLCAQTHWGGSISGDQVTMDWDADCECGRRGPRVMNNVIRYSDARGDDKITCAKSPGAYNRAVETIGGIQ